MNSDWIKRQWLDEHGLTEQQVILLLPIVKSQAQAHLPPPRIRLLRAKRPSRLRYLPRLYVRAIMRAWKIISCMLICIALSSLMLLGAWGIASLRSAKPPLSNAAENAKAGSVHATGSGSPNAVQPNSTVPLDSTWKTWQTAGATD